MLVLGIETSCDETAAAVVRDGKEILSNAIYSQEDVHAPFGGVYPELACRKHVDLLIPIVERALRSACLSLSAIDLIAVAKGPGLIGALLIGVQAAKALALALDRPFVGVNHVEAHLYAAMMPVSSSLPLPALGLVVSGGHTFLVKIHALGEYEAIGHTVDDAAGEAFDKVAALLGLPYPGGPAIEALAREGSPHAHAFPLPKVKGHPWHFSFSGLKTSVLYAAKGQNASKSTPCCLSRQQKADIAASFQETALRAIALKTKEAAQAFGCQALFCGGGVCRNQRLRALLAEHCGALPLFFPEAKLTLDNAAMIAGLGYHQYLRAQKGDALELEPLTRIPIA